MIERDPRTRAMMVQRLTEARRLYRDGHISAGEFKEFEDEMARGLWGNNYRSTFRAPLRNQKIGSNQ